VLDSLAPFKQIGIRIVERSDDLPVTAGEGGPAVSGRGLAGVCLGISGYAGYTANYIPRVCACNRYFAKGRRPPRYLGRQLDAFPGGCHYFGSNRDYWPAEPTGLSE
jgi:hypothetical protein